MNSETHHKTKEERILKAARKKQIVTYKGSSMRISSDFTSENLEARDNESIYSKC